MSVMLDKELYLKIKEYLDLNYEEKSIYGRLSGFNFFYEVEDHGIEARKESSLIREIENLDESFSSSVIRLIREKEMDETEVYKSINIDRRLFSKIRNENYHPSKETAIALCLGLKLNLEESEALLKKAGYALSNSNKFDVIIKYFISNEIYDIKTIDEALYEFDQKTISNYY